MIEEKAEDSVADTDNFEEERNYLISVPPELEQEYFLELGNFINRFAHAESGLNAVIRNFVSQRISFKEGKDYVIMNVIINSMTFEVARKTIKNLLTITKFSKNDLDEVSRILKQFYLINELRNAIVHNGSTANLTDKDGWFYTRSPQVPDQIGIELIYFKPQTLKNMAHDLSVIPDLLNYVINKKSYLNDKLYQLISGPWHFEISQLKYEGTKNRNRNRNRKK